MSQDPGCYLDAGIDLDAMDLIVVKSGYHFKLAFADMGECCARPGPDGLPPRAAPLRAGQASSTRWTASRTVPG